MNNLDNLAAASQIRAVDRGATPVPVPVTTPQGSSEDDRSVKDDSLPTSPTLIPKLRAGDAQAVWRLIADYHAYLTMTLHRRKLGLSPEHLHDLVQDICLTIHTRIATYDPDRGRPGQGRFRRWLSQVARNAAIDELRKRKLPCEFARIEMVAAPEENLFLEHRRRLKIIDHAYEIVKDEFDLEPLPFVDGSVDRVVIFDRLIDGEKPEDLAAEYGISRAKIDKTKHQVMQRLRAVAALIDLLIARGKPGDVDLAADYGVPQSWIDKTSPKVLQRIRDDEEAECES